MVILDTNIIIDHLRTQSSQSHLIKLTHKLDIKELAISTITIQELYEGRSTKNKQKEKDLLAVISPITTIDYSYDIAELAGKIARDQHQNIEFADTAIAATCMTNNASLATLNKKHFQNIKKLKLYPL